MANKCFYKGCNSTRKKRSTFWFPVLHEFRCKLWLKNSGNAHSGDIKDLSDQFLCINHFRSKDIVHYGHNNESITLALSAIPVPYVPNEGTTEIDVPKIQSIVSLPKQVNNIQPLNNAHIKSVQSNMQCKLQVVSKQLKVYTTRLDDMNIFRKERDCMTFSEMIPYIIAESIPFYIEKPIKKVVKKKPIKDRKKRLCDLLDKLKYRRDKFKMLMKKLKTVTQLTRSQHSKTIRIKVEELDTDLITCTENLLAHSDIPYQPKEEITECYSTVTACQWSKPSVATVDMLKKNSVNVSKTSRPTYPQPVIERFYLNLKNMDNRATFENKLQKFSVRSDLVLIMKVKLDLHVYHISGTKNVLSYKEYKLEDTNLEITLPKYGEFVKSVEFCCWFDKELFLSRFGSRFFNHVQFAREPHKCSANACSCCCYLQPCLKVENSEDFIQINKNSYLEKHKASQNASNNFIEKALAFSRNFALEKPKHDIDLECTQNSIVDDSCTVMEFECHNNYEYYENNLNNVISASKKRFTSESKRKADQVAKVKRFFFVNFCPLTHDLKSLAQVVPKFIKVNHNSSNCNLCKTPQPKITIETALEQLSLSLLTNRSELRSNLKVNVNDMPKALVDNSLATLERKVDVKQLVAAVPQTPSTPQPLVNGCVPYQAIAPCPVTFPKVIPPVLYPINSSKKGTGQPSKREVNTKVTCLGYKIPAAFTKAKRISLIEIKHKNSKPISNVTFNTGSGMEECVHQASNPSVETSSTFVPFAAFEEIPVFSNLPPLKPIASIQNQKIVLLKQSQTAENDSTQSEPVPSGSQQSPNSLPLVC